MTRKALQQGIVSNNNGNTMDKRINSYNRLLNAGFIKKEVFDNRLKNLQKGPSPSANHNNKAPAPLANHNNKAPPSANNTSNKANPSANHNNKANPSANNTSNKGPSLADHILSMKAPISNASGQYPCNGAPGRSIR